MLIKIYKHAPTVKNMHIFFDELVVYGKGTRMETYLLEIDGQ